MSYDLRSVLRSVSYEQDESPSKHSYCSQNNCTNINKNMNASVETETKKLACLILLVTFKYLTFTIIKRAVLLKTFLSLFLTSLLFLSVRQQF